MSRTMRRTCIIFTALISAVCVMSIAASAFEPDMVGSTDPLAPKRSLCNTFGGCGRSGKRSLCNTFGGCGRLTKRSLCNSPGGCSLSRGTKPSIWDYEDDSAPTGLVQPNARALLESTNRQTMMDYTSDPSDRTGARSVDQQYNQDYNFSPKLKQQLIDYSY